MRIFDRYILKLFIGYLLAGLVIFVTLYLAVDALSFAVRYADAGLMPFVRYYALAIPALVNQLYPVVCLFAVLFTFSQLNKSNELVALYSMGTSLVRIALPVLLAIVVLSLMMFWVSDEVLPRFAMKKKYVEYVEIRKKPGSYGAVKTNRIWYRSENVLFNIKLLDPDNSRAQGLTLYYFDEGWDLVQLLTAKSVEMRGSQWALTDGLVTLFVKESSFPLTESFTTKTITMNEEVSDLKSGADSSDQMSVSQLGRFIQRNKDAGLETTRYEVEYHAKFSFAMAAIVMSLLGLPFSVERVRSGGGFMNVGICIGMAFGYWTLYSSSLTLGKHGAVIPVAAAWLPNIICLGLAFFLIRRLRF